MDFSEKNKKVYHDICTQIVNWRFHADILPHPANPCDHNTLTASDRRILLANWFFKACKKVLEGDSKRKYFEHASALLTADGTDDDLIKLEGVPPGYRIKI